MALSPVMQISRMMRLRSSRDVSIGYLLVIVIGFAFWIAYGIAIRNPALVVPNTLALIVGIGTPLSPSPYGGRGNEHPCTPKLLGGRDARLPTGGDLGVGLTGKLLVAAWAAGMTPRRDLSARRLD